MVPGVQLPHISPLFRIAWSRSKSLDTQFCAFADATNRMIGKKRIPKLLNRFEYAVPVKGFTGPRHLNNKESIKGGLKDE